jgi:hypothetical protein
MANSVILALDQWRRKKVIHHEEGGKFYVETRQDVSHVVDAAKILAEKPPCKEDGWRFLGFLPDAVFDQAVNEGWIHDKKRIRQWFNDRDNRAFNGGRDCVS